MSAVNPYRAQLVGAVLALDAGARDDGITQDDRAEILTMIRDVRGLLADVAADVERDLVAAAGSARLVETSAGAVEIHRRTSRTGWRHDALLGDVLRLVVDEREMWVDEDGVRLELAETANRITARLRDCVSFGAGKVTGLRAVGLDPDEYCTTTYGDLSVRLPARKADVPKGE